MLYLRFLAVVAFLLMLAVKQPWAAGVFMLAAALAFVAWLGSLFIPVRWASARAWRVAAIKMSSAQSKSG